MSDLDFCLRKDPLSIAADWFYRRIEPLVTALDRLDQRLTRKAIERWNRRMDRKEGKR